ncbi:hypothetical protein EP47_06685 [Legionella norrlandica]|uniref:Uncharacterized protein n=1 Tax=Legionella norrlandica TaxID=1498499 RepID=A0A0A2SSQ1_9GAMM|nr:hypothetical protein [Legionella norrlandica]KGP62434.1 hypothetical protein EP47_06685 [Legionella norrlandica]
MPRAKLDSTDKSICTRENRPCIPDPDSVSEEQLLAAVADGESHWSNDYEEMAGIASATLRRMKAYGYKSVSELISKDPNFAYKKSLGPRGQVGYPCHYWVELVPTSLSLFGTLGTFILQIF